MEEIKLNKPYQSLLNTATVLGGSGAAAISMGMDEAEAEAIFDAARTANGHFSGMSDQEIIDYCSTLDVNQLEGMVSLVHGRVFENIVADETGGTLFEAQNHPNSDMTLDGEEISIKSNDTTAESISDVETLSPKDFGLDDQELYDKTAEVMDGDIIEAADAIMSGTVGIGIIAILQAVGVTMEEWEELSEKEKTSILAAWYGTKATGRAVASSAKNILTLIKLTGKGAKKSYDVHEEWADNGGYKKLRKILEESRREFEVKK